ncbi:hypothetical protein [Streptomyces sp. NPDC057877]|uniref:hypothetical protein n=1 Tax=Streptomyces sp. NPDC057877 TaxID=3346269 RepID=UPI0036A0ABC8
MSESSMIALPLHTCGLKPSGGDAVQLGHACRQRGEQVALHGLGDGALTAVAAGVVDDHADPAADVTHRRFTPG